MIEQIQQFLSWDATTRAACVAMHSIVNGNAPEAPKPKPIHEQPTVKCSPKKKYARRYFSHKRWTDEERMALFAEFEAGNRNFRELAKQFQRSEGSVRAQHDHSYRKFIGA
jgi:hypothetical protein